MATRVAWAQDCTETDETGARWEVRESGLAPAEGRGMPRLPERRAFQFAWCAVFPNTGLKA